MLAYIVRALSVSGTTNRKTRLSVASKTVTEERIKDAVTVLYHTQWSSCSSRCASYRLYSNSQFPSESTGFFYLLLDVHCLRNQECPVQNNAEVSPHTLQSSQMAAASSKGELRTPAIWRRYLSELAI
jgi:hypothetical protein